MFGMYNPEPLIRRKINVIALLIFTEIRRPYVAVILTQRCRNRAPIEQVSRVPDYQAGRVVEAGVRQIKVIAYPDRAGVGMISSKNRIAVSATLRLRKKQLAVRS